MGCGGGANAHTRAAPPPRAAPQDRAAEAAAYAFFPLTFVLPSEYRMLVDEFKRAGGTWIMKPIGRAQGQGIFLFNKLSQVGAEDVAGAACGNRRHACVHACMQQSCVCRCVQTGAGVVRCGTARARASARARRPNPHHAMLAHPSISWPAIDFRSATGGEATPGSQRMRTRQRHT